MPYEYYLLRTAPAVILIPEIDLGNATGIRHVRHTNTLASQAPAVADNLPIVRNMDYRKQTERFLLPEKEKLLDSRRPYTIY